MAQKILFPISSHPTAEAQKAFDWLASKFDRQAVAVELSELPNNRDFTEQGQLLWWHSDIECKWTASETAELTDFHSNLLNNGGRVLFTGLAAAYQHQFGLESVPPNHLVSARWTSETGERHFRGLMGYQDHPLFEPYFGGIYTWKPSQGENYCEVAYTGTCHPVQSEILAVERFYIGFDAHKRIAWQRRFANGYLLAIGCNIKFSAPNGGYSEHLSRFMSTCIEYLQSDSYFSSRLKYWGIRKYGIQESANADADQHPLPLPDEIDSRSMDEIIASPPEDQRFWDLAGRRILVAGVESHGIQEIWTYPFRSFRFIDWRIRGRGLPVADKISIRPDRVRREFHLNTVTITENVYYFLDHPAALLVLTSNQKEAVLIELHTSSDLRLMWPYDPGTSGKLQITAGRYSLTICDEHDQNTAVLWSSQALGRIEALDKSTQDHSGVEFRIELEIGRGCPLAFLFYGADAGRERTLAEAVLLSQGLEEQLLRVREHFSGAVGDSTTVKTPDESIDRALYWSAVKLDAFDVRVPGVGNGLAAGFGLTGEGWLTSRPGYAWFFGRDSVWSALALLLTGQFEIVRNVLDILSQYQEFTGKIFHELSTSGVVHYDSADSTPLFIYLAGAYLQHSGDMAFVERIWPNIQRAFEFCLTTDRDGDGFIENTDVGHGWIEGGRIFGAHVTNYLAAVWIAAMRQYAGMASALGKKEVAQTYRSKAEELRQDYNRVFWSEEKGHLVYGLDRKGNQQDALCIMPAVAILLDVAEARTSVPTLHKIDSREFSTDWGVRMLGRNHEAYNPRGYHYGSVWPLYTGWVALADFQAGRASQALLHWMHQIPHDLHFARGCMPEVIHGDNYGFAGVCTHQAWSEAMVLFPFYRGLLGLRPDAQHNLLEMAPQVPGNWPEMKVHGLRFGSAVYSFSYIRKNAEAFYSWKLVSGSPFEMCFRFPAGPESSMVRVFEDGNEVTSKIALESETEAVLNFELIGQVSLRVVYDRFIRFIPHIFRPQRDSESIGYTIVEEIRKVGEFRILISGTAGIKYPAVLIACGLERCVIHGARATSHIDERYALEFSVEESKNGYHEISVEYE